MNKIAYLAGLIDGEAYIGIKRSHTKRSVSPLYHERFQVRMVHEGSIKLLAKTFGGHYYLESGYRKLMRRPLYCWQLSDALAAKAAMMLLPFLIIKKPNAKILLALRKSKEDPRARKRGSPAKRVMNPGVLAHRERLYLQCKALNHAPVEDKASIESGEGQSDRTPAPEGTGSIAALAVERCRLAGMVAVTR